MLRIAICDDEQSAREALFLQLDKMLDEETEQIVYEFSSGESAVRWLQKHRGEVDLLFLDVEMDGMNGMETAESIRRFDQDIILVFVTGYADYVFDGYRVGALDYLMKPVDPEKLYDALARIRRLLFQDREKLYTLKNTDGTYRFRIRDILYFYSDRRKVVLVTEGGEYPFYEKLDRVGERLGHQFVRIHQRYLVNPQQVTYIGGNMVRIGQSELPVSRALKEEAVKKLTKAMLGGGR